MATVQNIFTNQASLDKAKEIMRDKMDVDKQEYLNIQDVKLSMCKMILDNNFIKINKKFETAYIDSETYQENTIKDMTLLLPDKLTAVTKEGNTQVTDIGNKVESVKTEITKLTDAKKSQLSTLITNATADIASANNPVGYKNSTEIILKDEVVLEGDVYLSIPNTAHYANYKSNGISLISNTYGRVEPYGITSVDGIDGKGTFENDSKILYGQMLKDEGLYFGQRLNPPSEYLTHIAYPNIDNVKSIIFNMEKPGLYDRDLTLYEGSEYNIILKHPYIELFTDDFENIVIINTVKNKLWINGVLITSDRYYNKNIVPALPLSIYDSSLRVNEKPSFKKEDLIEIFGRKPIGYDTVTMNPVDGVFSNPEGTCQGQLVLEEEKYIFANGSYELKTGGSGGANIIRTGFNEFDICASELPHMYARFHAFNIKPATHYTMSFKITDMSRFIDRGIDFGVRVLYYPSESEPHLNITAYNIELIDGKEYLVASFVTPDRISSMFFDIFAADAPGGLLFNQFSIIAKIEEGSISTIKYGAKEVSETKYIKKLFYGNQLKKIKYQRVHYVQIKQTDYISKFKILKNTNNTYVTLVTDRLDLNKSNTYTVFMDINNEHMFRRTIGANGGALVTALRHNTVGDRMYIVALFQYVEYREDVSLDAHLYIPESHVDQAIGMEFDVNFQVFEGDHFNTREMAPLIDTRPETIIDFE